MIAYPSIEHFAKLYKSVEYKTRYSKNEEGIVVYNEVPLPVINFIGTVKSHGCVHKDTLITLADGSQEKISDIQPGTCIISYNETTKTIEFDIVNDVIIQDLDKNWILLNFDDGTHLKCTVDHPVLTSVGWVSAENLTNEHEIVKF